MKDNLKKVLLVSFLIFPIVHQRSDKRPYNENSHLVSDQNQFQLLVCSFPSCSFGPRCIASKPAGPGKSYGWIICCWMLLFSCFLLPQPYLQVWSVVVLFCSFSSSISVPFFSFYTGKHLSTVSRLFPWHHSVPWHSWHPAASLVPK